MELSEVTDSELSSSQYGKETDMTNDLKINVIH